MAAGEPDLTLEEINALIGAAPESRVLIVAHWTWFMVQEAGRHLKTRTTAG